MHSLDIRNEEDMRHIVDSILEYSIFDDVDAVLVGLKLMDWNVMIISDSSVYRIKNPGALSEFDLARNQMKLMYAHPYYTTLAVNIRML